MNCLNCDKEIEPEYRWCSLGCKNKFGESYFGIERTKSKEVKINIKELLEGVSKEEIINGLLNVYNDHSLTDLGESHILNALEYLGFDIREV